MKATNGPSLCVGVRILEAAMLPGTTHDPQVTSAPSPPFVLQSASAEPTEQPCETWGAASPGPRPLGEGMPHWKGLP